MTTLVRPGFALWPLSHQYRHVIPSNPSALIANKRMMDIRGSELTRNEQNALVAILNSTWVGLTKSFFGRYTGTEGALGTDVLDVEMMEVPDVRKIDADIAKRLTQAFRSMCKRDIGGMVEVALKECHTYSRALELATRPIILPPELTQSDRRELDEAVFELIGATDSKERSTLINRLYHETALHFRDVRVTEIQKMEDRRSGGNTRLVAADLAADAWDALDLTDLSPLCEWVQAHATGPCEVAHIPAERPVHISDGTDLYDNETVYFGNRGRQHIECHSRGQAELIAEMARLGVTGDVSVPCENKEAMKLLDAINRRVGIAVERLRQLAASRSGDTGMRDQVFDLLQRWYVVGKSSEVGKQSGNQADS